MLALEGIDKIFIDEDIHQKAVVEVPTITTTAAAATQPLNINVTASMTTSPPPLPSPSFSLIASARSDAEQQPKSNQSTLNRASSIKHQQQQQQQPPKANTHQPNIFLWNSVVTIESPLQPGKKITIDRKSWITKLDDKTPKEPFIYSLDSIGCKM